MNYAIISSYYIWKGSIILKSIGIATVTHKLAEFVRDMITIGELDQKCKVSFYEKIPQTAEADFKLRINQNETFSDETIRIMSEILTELFIDTNYSVGITKKPCFTDITGTVYAINIVLRKFE